jgi:endoglycosylceramidase
MVLLQGAIPAGLLDFWTGSDQTQPDVPPLYPIDPAAYTGGQCPPNSRMSHYPALCHADLSEMSGLGFNSVRLPLSWSLLEPERGRFNQMYVDRIAQVVDWAKGQGMYVIIDMHQNAYSRFIGSGPGVDLSQLSGAPKWATITDGLPSRVIGGQRELNATVFEAATNFWYNRDGIQDEYIAAVAYLAKRFKDDSAVAGYSVFNEPWPGWNLSPGFEDLLLFPFYRRVIDAITGVRDGIPCWTGFFMPVPCGYRDLGVHDLRHLIFLDTGLAREITDFPTHLGLPLSSYPNVVLSMHAYTHFYTVDGLLHQAPEHASYPFCGYDQSYSLAEREAKAMNAALFVAEFGSPPSKDSLLLVNQFLELERHRLGFAFWTWKENGGAWSWGMFNAPASSAPESSSGCLRSSRERLLARVYPRASADPNLSYHYESATGAFNLKAIGKAGDPPTRVYFPPQVTAFVSAAGSITSSLLTTNPDGSRLLDVIPSGGAFSVSVAAGPLDLKGC